MRGRGGEGRGGKERDRGINSWIGKYWQDPKNRRNFYLKFAHSRGFDPFVASNWYKYNYDSIIAAKVCLKRGMEEKREEKKERRRDSKKRWMLNVFVGQLRSSQLLQRKLWQKPDPSLP